MLTSQKINYEIGGNVEATPYGGIFAMHRLVTRLGLVKAIDAALNLLKIHLPYHESDHVLTLAYSVLTGGTRLEDVDRLRNDVPLMNGLGAKLLPDPTTTGDFLRRFSEADIVALMDAINSIRPALWRGRGADLVGEVVYLDADGTIVPTTGECKQGMNISYKGIWGYAPLLITLANTREVLYLVNRPGNAPSHLDAATWIDKAIALVRPYAKRVCLRGDTDFSRAPSEPSACGPARFPCVLIFKVGVTDGSWRSARTVGVCESRERSSQGRRRGRGLASTRVLDPVSGDDVGMQFMVSSSPRAVSAWSRTRLPFQPVGWQRQLRDELRAALRLLSARRAVA